MVKSVILFFLCLLLTATYVVCQKTEFKKSPIIGVWIETSKKMDTLIFLPEYDGQNPIFQLKRGFDANNKSKLPKAFSGPYWYKLDDKNRILINWFLSSDANFHSYYFRLSKNKMELRISDFFNDGRSQKDTLIFTKEK